MGGPLGSGMAERAWNWLIQQRCKGGGMQWSEDGFTPLVSLRRAWGNGRFKALLFALTLSPNLSMRPLWTHPTSQESPRASAMDLGGVPGSAGVSPASRAGRRPALPGTG